MKNEHRESVANQTQESHWRDEKTLFNGFLFLELAISNWDMFKNRLALRGTSNQVELWHIFLREVFNNKCPNCPKDAHCHRHCRIDSRITKDCRTLRVIFDMDAKEAHLQNWQKILKELFHLDHHFHIVHQKPHFWRISHPARNNYIHHQTEQNR